jgi:hypothetical protein
MRIGSPVLRIKDIDKVLAFYETVGLQVESTKAREATYYMNSVLSMQLTMLINHYHDHLLSYIMILMQRVNPDIQQDYFILQYLSQTERALLLPIWHLEIQA